VGKGDVTSVAFSPDSKTLASGGWDETIRLWDVATGAEVRRLSGHAAGMVATVVFSPNGKYLASRGGNDGTVRLWDPATGHELFKREKIQNVNPWRFNRDTALAFAPDGKTLAIGDRAAVRFLDVPSGRELRHYSAHAACAALTYSADGRLLATGGADGKDQNSLRLWDLATGQELRRCALPKDEPPISLAFAPDSKHLAAAVEEDDLRIFAVDTGKPVHRLKHYWPSRVAYSPDGKTLASVRGATIRLWDPATGQERFPELDGHQAGVAAVAVSPDGKLIASAGEDVRLWEAATGKPVQRIAARAADIAFSPSGKQLATAGRDRIVHLWDVATSKDLAQLKGHRHPLQAVAFSPDGRMLASGDAQATLRLWDLKTNTEVHHIDVKSGADHLALAFTPDGKTLACAGAWNDSSFLPPGGINVQGVEMTPKHGYLVLLWDVATGKELRRFAGLKDKAKSVAFSPDGQLLAAGSADGKLCLWEASTGREVLYIVAHPDQADVSSNGAPCVAFSPDGRVLASGSTDQTIRLWDVTNAKELARFHADGAVNSLVFTRDGKTLVSGGGDTTVLIWDAVHPVVQPPAKPNDVILIGD
jgi:WD40 repeat protein